MKNTNRRWWDWWTAIFLIVMLFIVALRLIRTAWTPELYLLAFLVMLGAVSGLAFGASRFSSLATAAMGTVYGIFFLGWLLGSTISKNMTWYDRIVNYLGFRLQNTIAQVLAGQPVTDTILFMVLIGILLWVISMSAGYAVTRHASPWAALLPAGVTLLVVSQYDPDIAVNSRYLVAWLFFALLIIGRLTFLRYSREWEKFGIFSTTDINWDISKAVFILSAVVILIAFLIPVTGSESQRYSDLWQSIQKPFKGIQENLTNIFEPLQSNYGPETAFFGTQIGLGSGDTLSDEVLFTVRSDKGFSMGLRNYWRARSYDQYLSGQWVNTTGLITKNVFPDDAAFNYPAWRGKEQVTYTFKTRINLQTNLFTAQTPLWVSRPIRVTYLEISTLEMDTLALFADPALASGDEYQVKSLISVPTVHELQKSSTDYPAWLERYLQLPETFSARVTALAEQLTAGLDNPYDKAYVITRWLRQNITYAPTITPPPQGADPLEWFLFESKTGYCQYYATAEVMMLRALGIPARLSVGYAEGELDDVTGVYTVRQKDSHAWPEVYFNDFGWVEFEPTANQPERQLPQGVDPNAANDPENFEPEIEAFAESDLEDPFDKTPPKRGTNTFIPVIQPEPLHTPFILSAVALVIITAYAYGLVMLLTPKANRISLPVQLINGMRRRGIKVPFWLQKLTEKKATFSLTPFQQAYEAIGKALQLLRMPVYKTDTPAERAERLAKHLPELRIHTQTVCEEYEKAVYSRRRVNAVLARQSAERIRKISRETWMRRMLDGYYKKNKPKQKK